MNFNLDFKALAYAAWNLSDAEPVSPCPCSLVFRCDDAKLATLLLAVTLPTAHGTDDTFVLQYDADELVPYTVRLTNGNAHITPSQLDAVVPVKGKGKTRPDIKTLDLSIKHPCPLWCPAQITACSPKPGYESAFQQLAHVAKATRLHIVFDYKQLRKERHSMFKAFSKAVKGLVGYPVDALLIKQGLRKASWEVFAPTEPAGAPPAYEGSRVRKRPRQGSPSSPIQPSRCWTPKSPTESHTSEKTIPFSPDAAATAFERARLHHQTDVIHAAIEKQLPAHLDKVTALQAEAIDAAVARQLLAYFGEAQHTEAVDAAVGRQLDTALQARLPDAIEDVLISKDVCSSPASSFASLDSRGHRYPKLPALTRVGRTMLPHLRTHLTDQFKLYQQQQLLRFEKLVDTKYSEVETAAYDDRVEAQGEFETEMEEHKADISLLQKDSIDNLWREGDKVLEQGRALCLAFGEDINEQLFGLCDKIDRLNRYALRKMVVAEVSRQQRRKKGVPRGWGRNMLKGEQRLLGRRRRGAEDEWADIS
ncbi:hypothetical protein EKO04_011606 [Ascochyta lentis]|uniref:Uncharacterized protein n=1 Tax=Ascochyta lentis TaxID=205686 RepID=A0A8H7ISX3_9PLEO|nr:hypothetical protein EKO04_011606 [Ascochyta lentis]